MFYVGPHLQKLKINNCNNRKIIKYNNIHLKLISFSYCNTVTKLYMYVFHFSIGVPSLFRGLGIIMVPLYCCSESSCTCMLYEMPSLSDSSSDRLFVPRTFRRVVCANSRVAWSALDTLTTEQIGSKTRKYNTPSTLTVTESFVRNCSHINTNRCVSFHIMI